MAKTCIVNTRSKESAKLIKKRLKTFAKEKNYSLEITLDSKRSRNVCHQTCFPVLVKYCAPCSKSEILRVAFDTNYD